MDLSLIHIYKTCKLLNNTKNKGVLIPSSNKDDIILEKEVEDAVEKGEFHIYTMDTLDDAIELMMLEGNESIDYFYEIISKEIRKYKPSINKNNIKDV